MKAQPTTKELIAMLYERLPELFDRAAPTDEIQRLAAQPAPESGSWYAASDIDKMVRDLDVAMNGEGSAPQAKLCDLMPQLIQRLTSPAQPAPVISAGPITPEMANWSEAHKAKLAAVMEKRLAAAPEKGN